MNVFQRLLLFLVIFKCVFCLNFLQSIYSLYNQYTDYEVNKTTSNEWNGTIWAVLVAGSNGWYNYRHQADVCHAYQVLLRHGISDKNIIVMMYDDIANNENNPTEGIIINKPGGKDVYKGVPKDYIGKDVTPEMLLRVLQGDHSLARQGRKVVKSGPNDHIFLYFSDHGAPGLIAFPSSELYAKDLNRVLRKMTLRKKFKKMVIYIEACESGSMFNGLLPSNINIFATTAANSTESSYACYYDDERETYLGDVYSVNWLEDSDRALLSRETLQQQYKTVFKKTNTSHVKEFGDLTISNLHVSQFQGSKRPLLSQIEHNTIDPLEDAVPSGDVPLAIAQKKLANSKDEIQWKLNNKNYQNILKSRNFLVSSIKNFLHNITIDYPVDSIWNQRQTLVNHDCYLKILQKFDEHCFDLSTHQYALRYLYVFVNLCESLDENENEIAEKWVYQMVKHCQSHVAGHQFERIL